MTKTNSAALPPLPEHDPDPKEPDAKRVRDISVAVYKERLGPTETASMLENDGDGGAKLRHRAASYDSLTRSYMKAMGL